VTLSGGDFYLPHDEWLARDALGNEIAGRKLAVFREVAELKWEQSLDSSNHWSSIAKLGFNHNRDNGGGFFDFYRYYLSEELRWHNRNWDIRALANLSYFDFPVQTLGTPASPTFHLTTLDVTARIERRVYKGLRCFAAFEFEQAASDDPTAEYRDHVWSGGISWEF
jgi:hypothetical protein